MYHAAARVFSSLADRIGDLTRLADSDTDIAMIVANHDNRAEGESTATFDYFCYALYIDDALVKLLALVNPRFSTSSTHVLLHTCTC